MRIRRAADRDTLRSAVRDLQRKFIDDPPAVFLAWSETSRAVRRRFMIPPEADRDIFASLPQWRPAPQGESE